MNERLRGIICVAFNLISQLLRLPRSPSCATKNFQNFSGAWRQTDIQTDWQKSDNASTTSRKQV